jgi:SAM-dependent methyltransferase
MQPEFLRDKVIEHFTVASADYAHRGGIIHLEEDPIIVDFIKSDIGPARVLEVGGGTGYLLSLLAKESNDAQLYNCELTYQAYRDQADPNILFIGGNGLSLPFSESKFDYVIAKNLLHHLVSNTRKKSKILAQRAAAELQRVVKNEGYIIIVEQYHQYRFCASILFYLTLFLSKGSVRLEALGIRPKVVVSFLTPSEIKTLFRSQTEQDGVILDRSTAISSASPTSPIRLLPLLNKFGRLLLIKTVKKRASLVLS